MVRIGRSILAAVLYLGALYLWASTPDVPVQIVLDRAVSGTEAERIWQQETKSLCFWEQTLPVLVSCRETGGTALVSQLLLAGNPALMDAPSLSWQEGCLVDAKTARRLFGTDTVGAQVLWLDGKACPVLGVVEAAQPCVVRLAQEEETMTRLALPPQTKDVSSCLLTWGLSGKLLDTALFRSLTRNLLLLFPAAVLFVISRETGRKYRALGRLLWVGGLCILLSQLSVPGNMIPDRWSDFSFWGRWWAEEKENALQLLSTSLGNTGLQMGVNMVKSMAASVMASLLMPRRNGHANSAD